MARTDLHPQRVNTLVEPARVFVARDLSKTYQVGEVEVRALHDVSLEIYEREFVVLLGPSGSGKSTLLNILGGLDSPTSGEARWRDHDLVAADEAELTRYRREHVGFVFQFFNLIPSPTALENVALVSEIAEHPLDPREALDLVGLSDRLDHFPSQLSGGEQQRVAVGVPVFVWFWLLIVVFNDLFRRQDISGWAKALWVIVLIVLSYIGVFAYLITGKEYGGAKQPASSACT